MHTRALGTALIAGLVLALTGSAAAQDVSLVVHEPRLASDARALAVGTCHGDYAALEVTRGGAGSAIARVGDRDFDLPASEAVVAALVQPKGPTDVLTICGSDYVYFQIVGIDILGSAWVSGINISNTGTLRFEPLESRALDDAAALYDQ